MPPRRPRPVSSGRYRAGVVRGPRPDGRWYWRVRLFADAGESNVWSGWATVDEVDLQMARLTTGEASAPTPTGDRCDTVHDIAELWLGHVQARRGVPARTVDTVRATVRAWVRHMGAVRVDRLDVVTLDRYVRARETEGRSSHTIHRELRVLRQAWTWLRERGLVPDRPAPRVHVRVRAERDDYTPTAAEVARVVGHLQGWPRLLTRLLWATGCRLGELAGLRRSALRLTPAEDAWVDVAGKTGPRSVPLSPALARELLLELGPGDPEALVLPVTESSAQTSLRRYLADACALAGCRRWTAQGLRRLAVDAVYEAGVDPGTAGRLIGHSPAVALRFYRRANAANVRDAARRARLGEER